MTQTIAMDSIVRCIASPSGIKDLTARYPPNVSRRTPSPWIRAGVPGNSRKNAPTAETDHRMTTQSIPLIPPGYLSRREKVSRRASTTKIRMRRAVRWMPPTTTTSPIGIVKNAIRKGMIAFLRGRTTISTMARSSHTTTKGLITESAAPPPNLRFSGTMVRSKCASRLYRIA